MSPKNNPFAALFSLFSIFLLVDSKNDCLTRLCGNNKNLPIHYPFQLEGDKHQKGKGCDQTLAVNLKCSNQTNVPILNLPSFGDLYVRNINYSSQIIQLYDPNNCLPGLFLNSSFLPYPLIPINYQNYTFYECPLNATSSSNFTAIGCLHNSTFSVLATSSISRAQEMNNLGCNMVRTVPIPVSTPLQYEYNGFIGDLSLTWDVPNCEVCQNVAKHKKRNAGVTAGLIIASLTFPIWGGLILYLLAMAFLLFVTGVVNSIRFMKRKLNVLVARVNALAARVRNRSARGAQADQVPSGVQLPVVTAQSRRIDVESGMNTIVIGESRRIPGPNSSVCPICLDDYNPRDTIKCSTKCEHYFHASCIDLWLRTHNSCPVCRTVAS